jgi:aminobutyraldehyde dehydrogenase
MLIGQSFVAGTETPERVLNPKTEEVLTTCPSLASQVDGP